MLCTVLEEKSVFPPFPYMFSFLSIVHVCLDWLVHIIFVIKLI